jgi:hypothetical protein
MIQQASDGKSRAFGRFGEIATAWAVIVKMADCARLRRAYPPYNVAWFLMGALRKEIPAAAAVAFAGMTGGGSLAMIWEKVVDAGLRRHDVGRVGVWMGRNGCAEPWAKPIGARC